MAIMMKMCSLLPSPYLQKSAQASICAVSASVSASPELGLMMRASYPSFQASRISVELSGLGFRVKFCGRTNWAWNLRSQGRLGAKNNGSGRVAQVRCLFTGIVEEMGRVKEVKVLDNGGFEMIVEASKVIEDVKLGDSIAVNGTCLTVTRFDSSSFSVGLAPETLRRTSLGEAAVGSSVNLERSLQPSSRMGGHFVQGHVDGTGTILSMEPEEDSLWVKVRTTPELLRYIVPKGYIAVDGTSLTVVEVLDKESAFTFMLVAYTQQKIILPGKKVGGKVNLEVDIVGKYVERMLQGYQAPVVTA